MRRRWVALTATLVTGLAVGTAAPVAALPHAMVTQATAVEGDLSEDGRQAITDLRTCLSTENALNVYYLIDSSRSLSVADDGGPGSDPEGDRAEILANSLRQLGTLVEAAGSDAQPMRVNWAAGFFNTRFESAFPWQAWTDTSGDDLEVAIREQPTRGYTDWEEGLGEAQRALASQQNIDPGCQMLIWLTDGQIDSRAPDGPNAEDHDALNRMCGALLDPQGAAPPSADGIFNDFRRSGVVVIGALLATNAQAIAAGQVMQPLVEGSVNGEQPTCGMHPIPKEAPWVHGAFVQADSADDLSRVFQSLGAQLQAQLEGGSLCPIDADGRFSIDPGVGRFRFIPGGDWTLTHPSGVAVQSTAPSPEWIIDPDNNPLTVDAVTTSSDAHGEWLLDAGDRTIFCFTDLEVVFESSSPIVLAPDGAMSEDGAALPEDIVAHVQRVVPGSDGVVDEPVSLNIFDDAVVDVLWDGELLPRNDFEADLATGSVRIPVRGPIDTEEVTIEVIVTSSTSESPGSSLITEPSGTELSPVTGRQSLAVIPESHFPHVESVTVDPDTLVGGTGSVQVKLMAVGPEVEGSGTVCIEDVSKVDDHANRDVATWEWHGLGNCVDVTSGESKPISISVTNTEAADSDSVVATLQIKLIGAETESADPVEGTNADTAARTAITLPVEIRFTTTDPVNEWLVYLLTFVLLVLGILLPLLALWLLNWRTTRLDIDNGIQRASFRVRIGPGGVAFADVPASDSALAERFQYRPPQRNVRSVDDPDLGRLAAHVPWFPLAEPTYRITPRPGASIIGARTSARAASAGVRRDDGSMEFRQLPLDAFWAVLVSNADLARTKRGDEVNGTAVLYHRMDPSQQDQYRARLNDIGLEGSLTDAVDRTRAGLAEAQAKQNAKKSSKGGDTPSTAAPPTPGAPGRDGAPPPRGGATPPPREAGAPPRDGTPPPRGGTAPPSRGGTTPPPRPGSSGPPPLPGSPPHGSPPPRPGSPPPRGR